MKVAFAGLGVMGFPMAGHLAKAGHEMAVFNRSPDKAARWVAAHGGRAGATAAEAAAGAEVFVLCVGNDDDVRQVVREALPAMAPGGVVVHHTTTSAVVFIFLSLDTAQPADLAGSNEGPSSSTICVSRFRWRTTSPGTTAMSSMAFT